VGKQHSFRDKAAKFSCGKSRLENIIAAATLVIAISGKADSLISDKISLFGVVRQDGEKD
jgi:hypothetical protein